MKRFIDFFAYKQDKIQALEEARIARQEEDLRIEKFLVLISNTMNRIQSENPAFSYKRESDKVEELQSYTMNYTTFIEDDFGEKNHTYYLTFLLKNNPTDENMIITLENPETKEGVESRGYYDETDEYDLEARLTDMFQSQFDLDIRHRYDYL